MATIPNCPKCKHYIPVTRPDRRKGVHGSVPQAGVAVRDGIVKNFIREIRPKMDVPAIYRYETKPGVQAQVDWAECGKIEIDGKIRKLPCFTMILGFSRMRFAEFTLQTDVFTLIQCHKNAFDYFGGYPVTSGPKVAQSWRSESAHLHILWLKTQRLWRCCRKESSTC